jgi:hypothetical protein
VFFFLPSTDCNATVEEMIWTFGTSFKDHARDRLRGINPITWESNPGRTPSVEGEQGLLDTDAVSNEYVNDAERPSNAVQDPTTETGEKRPGEKSTEAAEKVTGV